MSKEDKIRFKKLIKNPDSLLNSYEITLEIILIQTERLRNIVEFIDTNPNEAKRHAEKALKASRYLLENAGILTNPFKKD